MLSFRQLAVRTILPTWFDYLESFLLTKKQKQNKNNCLPTENHIETPYQPSYLVFFSLLSI